MEQMHKNITTLVLRLIKTFLYESSLTLWQWSTKTDYSHNFIYSLLQPGLSILRLMHRTLKVLSRPKIPDQLNCFSGLNGWVAPRYWTSTGNRSCWILPVQLLIMVSDCCLHSEQSAVSWQWDMGTPLNGRTVRQHATVITNDSDVTHPTDMIL